ncbi:LOW QUALITY PROTEIN: charged multivesicular body protein 2a [Falco peregrinus]|uniref:LOW QUALITY PROTEIN: charged multivesicular body protein 2a n=1 Tax=Falco peregrinus TaxID=8954 RepID=UPI002479C3F4|nr:LOW QUALITY PROTEIN: charged multivesicular body protein 2a [Falco peregrinus]
MPSISSHIASQFAPSRPSVSQCLQPASVFPQYIQCFPYPPVCPSALSSVPVHPGRQGLPSPPGSLSGRPSRCLPQKGSALCFLPEGRGRGRGSRDRHTGDVTKFAEVRGRGREVPLPPWTCCSRRRKTPEELLRQNQRALARAMRELDRERQKLEAQEKKIIVDIKKMAKQGQMDAVKIMAKDLVRTRRYVKKFITMRANVQAVSLKIQTLKSNNSMAQAMKGVTKAMATMNRQLKLPQIQKIMMEFEKQAEIMDMKEELMNDAIDDAMGDEDDEEESDAVVSQVLDELGLNLTDELATLPLPGGVAGSGRGRTPEATAALADADADLEERLKNLRRD